MSTTDIPASMELFYKLVDTISEHENMEPHEYMTALCAVVYVFIASLANDDPKKMRVFYNELFTPRVFKSKAAVEALMADGMKAMAIKQGVTTRADQ